MTLDVVIDAERLARMPKLGDEVLQRIGRDRHPLSRDELESERRLAGRNYGPAILLTAWMGKRIDTDTLAAVIGDVWSSAEFPMDYLRQADWLEMFRAAGYTSEGEPATPKPVRLYRGAPYTYRRRWSWTDDLDRAKWFATKYRRLPGRVWVLDAPAESLLCYVGGYRQEREYVVNTKGLKITPHDA